MEEMKLNKGITPKVVKVRLNHVCDHCGRVIPKGELANFMSIKNPRYDKETEEQIGIWFYKSYLCHDDELCIEELPF